MTRFGPLFALPLICAASVFDAPELRVNPSPALSARIHLAPGVRVLDFDVSPSGPRVALLTTGSAGAREVLLWDIGQPQPAKIWSLPAGFAARSMVWHPHGRQDVHVHACDNKSMRTTIEMKPEHRARVLELAANRGEKGFSSVVAEALERYLEAERGRTNAIRSALALKGSMKETEAAGLETRTRQIRANWR